MNLWHISDKNVNFSPDKLHSQESVYTIGNGYFCTRGTFEEGYPGANPATLLYGVFDKVAIAGEELANVPDWLPVQLFVNGERFRLDRGRLLAYQRTLDMEHGLLQRTIHWESTTGIRLLITIERFASLADVHVGLIRYSVTSEHAKHDLSIELLASFNTAVGNSNLMHWETVAQDHQDSFTWLKSVTRSSSVELAQTMSFVTNSPDFTQEFCDSDIAPAIRFLGKLAPRATVTAEKIVVMYTSRDNPDPLAHALETHEKVFAQGYGAQLAQHQQAWHGFWQDADILIEGDDTAQRAVRYSIYQLRINAALHDPRYSVAAKGMTGFGYHGHIFHDTEIFMFPFFAYTLPDVARNLLIYRYHTLPAARKKAQQNGYAGAQYPWESTLSGVEMTPSAIVHPENGEIIPVLNGSLEIHISASIAYATWQYWVVTGDDAFLRDYGAEIILSTALFWSSRVEKHLENQSYEITNVIGPDEWHEHVNNNAFTNGMARWNLQKALAVLTWVQHEAPEKARALEQQLDLTAQRLDSWQDIVKRIEVPQDAQNGLFEQFDGFFKLKTLDQEQYAGRTTSYQGIFGVKDIQKYRISKQADVLMLLTLLDQEFDLKTKGVNWDYYYPITDHEYGSSLTPAFHVILACELGKISEAADLFLKGCLVDLKNLRGNTPEGIHLACCGAVWQAVIFGFAGLRLIDDGYTTAEHLPATWTRLAFSFLHKGHREYVDIRR
ncbi:MAG: glycoside hydrolase family 65 protein [Ktedonobacteraceae bacterium]